MNQTSLFPNPCPCGEPPVVDEREGSVVFIGWCRCPSLVVIEAPSVPEGVERWNEAVHAA